MEDELEALDLVRDWIGRLEAFADALDDVEGDDATDFCDSALDAWKRIGLPGIKHASPDALVIFEALNALASVGTAAAMDWADTPDVRDRYTRESAQQLVAGALDDVLSECKLWLSHGLPPSDEIQQRFSTVAAELQRSMEVLEHKNSELEAQDAEAEMDRYGAIVIHRDPSRSDAPICEKVCSFTEAENTRYVDAYSRIRRMLGSDLLRHIEYERDRVFDAVYGVRAELDSQRASPAGSAATEEWARKLRSALISFTAALQIHEYQTVRAARRTLRLDRAQVNSIKQVFIDVKRNSFEYRWLEALRDALQHGDIGACNFSFNVSRRADPEVTITMDRAFMLEERMTDNRTKPWLKRRELEELDSDPNVMDMIKAVQPLLSPLQKELDELLYPNVAEDAETVRELVGRFEGRAGSYYLQTGPGFTRRRLAPPMTELEPRVLHYAQFVYTSATGAIVRPEIVRSGAYSTILHS